MRLEDDRETVYLSDRRFGRGREFVTAVVPFDLLVEEWSLLVERMRTITMEKDG